MINNFSFNHTLKHYCTLSLILLCLFAFLGQPKAVAAKTYLLAIQPILPKEQTLKFYQPLARFLSQATGHNIKIFATSNYVTYWEELQKNKKYDLVLDAAHFADYRVKNYKYTILTKIRDTLSFSLVTNENVTYFDSEELTGKRISTVGSPSLTGISLFHMFPNPSRQPVIIGANNFAETLKKLKSERVNAAFVPTSLISGDNTINTIMVTEPIPHLALAASDRVDKVTKDKIRSALLNANNTEAGTKLFNTLNFSGFEKANNKTYSGYESLLRDVWGYKY